MKNKTKKSLKITREDWLQQANAIMRDGLFKLHGYELPEDVQVSVGFPLGFRVGSKKQAIGQCFSRATSDAGVNEIFINPNQQDSKRVLGILVHEDIHAIDDCVNGHKGAFRTMATAVGLEGKMTATTESEELNKYFEDEIIAKIGEYPHKKAGNVNLPKQTTRNIKMICGDGCGFSWRASRSMISTMENNTCNGCGEDSMRVA